MNIGSRSLGWKRLLRTGRFASIRPSCMFGVAVMTLLLPLLVLSAFFPRLSFVTAAILASYAAVNLGFYSVLARYGSLRLLLSGILLLSVSQLAGAAGITLAFFRKFERIARRRESQAARLGDQ